jgi:predicted amidohydrolase YtcJ
MVSFCVAAVAGVQTPASAQPPASAQSPATPTSANLVLLHGKIHTQDASRSIAQALAIRGGKILAIGADQEVSALIGPGTRTIDLKGRTVLPGLIDAHTHPAEGAQDLGKCNLKDKALSPAQIKARVAACLEQHSDESDRWYDVVQVNPSGVTLTLADLDSMLTARPMLLEGSDGHTVWANSAALKAAGINASTQDPAGGRIERDASGRATGTLRDTAAEIVLRAEPRPSLSFETDQLDKAFDGMRALGITSVQDADDDDHFLQLYKRLYDSHRLNMRVRATLGLKRTDRPADSLIGAAVRFRSKWAIDPELLRADAVKLFADGVIEYPAQTAALLEPYLDARGQPTRNRGPTYIPQEQLNRIVTAADAAGFTVHIHAIGDRAVRSSLDAFAAARLQNGARDNRDQIAHLEVVDPADFPRFKQLGVIANFQLLWAVWDADYMGKATLPYLGPERSRYIYPARSLRDAGALIAGGSDWDVSSFNPFEAMECAVTRREAKGQEPLLPEQSISLQDVVDAYTIHAAYALKQERTTGSLEVGKLADFVVLDKDIFAIDPYELHSTRVLATYLGGREVYADKARH